VSDLEETLALHIKAAGLPEPVREYMAIKGRRYRLDFAWPAVKLGVEVQGGIWHKGGHSTGTGITRDCEKANAHTLAGWRIIYLTAADVNSGAGVEVIKQALEARE